MGRCSRPRDSREVKFAIVGRLCQTPILWHKAFHRIEPAGAERDRRAGQETERAGASESNALQRLQRDWLLRFLYEFLESWVAAQRIPKRMQLQLTITEKIRGRNPNGYCQLL